jgi:quercetin dioxygenase-like cupin family protein
VSEPKRDLPAFLTEALAEEAGDSSPVERLPELFDGAPPSAGLSRLMSAVEAPPLRYAPFIARLGAFWDLPEAEVERVLESSKSLTAWTKVPIRGVRVIEVAGGPRTTGLVSRLVRFEPSLRFPKHRHPGYEAAFVLEGSYTDSLGTFVGPGDLHEMHTGTEHGFLVGSDGPCIAATTQAGLEFTGPVMRLLQKLFG